MNTLTATVPASVDFAPAQPVIGVKVRNRRVPWGRILGGAAVAIVASAAIGGYVYHAAGFATTDDAFIDGHVHPISSRINGTVSRVLVDDNAHVEAGQPLVEIDPSDLNLAAQWAQADLAQARANADQMTAQINRAQAEVEAAAARTAQAAAQLDRAELDFHRMEKLVEPAIPVVSWQDYDASRTNFAAAQAAQKAAQAESVSAEASLAAAQAQRAVANAQVQKAETALAQARLQTDYTIIRAPSSGRVAKKNVEVGQRLQPGQPVMAVVDDQVWVVANFKESQLARMRVGQKVAVTVDAIEGRVFAGVVDSFSPGTGAKFALLAPDNATGNFNKVVQRVPVKIVFSAASLGEAASRLSPGLSVFAQVSLRR